MAERAFRELMAIIKRHVPLFMNEAPCRQARGHRKLTQESYKAQLIYCSCRYSDNRGNAGEKQDRCFLLFRPRGYGNGCCKPILGFVNGDNCQRSLQNGRSLKKDIFFYPRELNGSRWMQIIYPRDPTRR
ncbi:uncharacterized protein LOC102670861 [Apis dorsata]|uniref:uncharacterized protein LOC102670861 n=1 Tax=Apis dorsata TaxID=7462 RepID=UPI0003DF73CB|nr:uncharacterized protein LOC102670861 [Apis dorsata]